MISSDTLPGYFPGIELFFRGMAKASATFVAGFTLSVGMTGTAFTTEERAAPTLLNTIERKKFRLFIIYFDLIANWDKYILVL